MTLTSFYFRTSGRFQSSEVFSRPSPGFLQHQPQCCTTRLTLRRVPRSSVCHGCVLSLQTLGFFLLVSGFPYEEVLFSSCPKSQQTHASRGPRKQGICTVTKIKLKKKFFLNDSLVIHGRNANISLTY